MHVSFQSHLPLKSLLVEPQSIGRLDPREAEGIRVRAAPSPPCVDRLRDAFERAVAEGGETLSLSKIAERIGTTVDSLRYYFPDLCRAVSKQAKAALAAERARMAADAPNLIASIGANLAALGTLSKLQRNPPCASEARENAPGRRARDEGCPSASRRGIGNHSTGGIARWKSTTETRRQLVVDPAIDGRTGRSIAYYGETGRAKRRQECHEMNESSR